MRDIFNHEKTVRAQWMLATMPNYFTKHETRFGRFVEEGQVVEDDFAPMCQTLAETCYPVLVIDPEKLVEPGYGPIEARKMAELVNGTEGFEDWMIEEEVSSDIIVSIVKCMKKSFHTNAHINLTRHGSVSGMSLSLKEKESRLSLIE